MRQGTINGWYVLYVKSRHEKKVHELLIESSIESFLPLIKTTRKWSDRKKVILKPLFPSYVFVKITSSLDFYKALSVYGASAYISFGVEYANVRDEEIDKIKLLLDSEHVSNIAVNADKNVPVLGESRKINHGPLKGLECEILNVNNKNRLIVRIDSIRQSIIATVPLHYFQDKVPV